MLAENLYGWDEIGICLSFGVFRAAVICQKFPDKKIHFVINDCDNISSLNEKEEQIEVIEDKGYFKNIWSAVNWYFPLKPVIYSLSSTELTKNLALKRNVTDKMISWLRKNCSSAKDMLIINSPLNLIGKDLDFHKWNGLKQIIIDEYKKEFNWAIQFSSSSESKNRAEQLLKFIEKDNSISLINLQINLAKKMLGNRIKNLKFDTFSNFFSTKNIDSQQHILLNMFIENPKKMLSVYNSLISHTPIRQFNDRIPYFGIIKKEEHWIREPVVIKNLNTLEQYEALIPKAMALYTQSKLIGSTYCSTAPHLEIANNFCFLLKQKSYDLIFVKFNPKRIFRERWNTKINIVPKDEYQKKTVEYLKKKSNNFWNHRLPLVFAYIVGGEDLIDKVISNVELEITSSEPEWTKNIKVS